MVRALAPSALLLVGAALLVYRDTRAELDDAAEHLAHHSRLAARQLEALIDDVDANLRALATSVREVPLDDAALEGLLVALDRSCEPVRGFGVIDRQGRYRWDSLGGRVRDLDVSDRRYVRAHLDADRPHDRMALEVVDSRRDGQRVLICSRAVFDVDGRPRAVVTGTVLVDRAAQELTADGHGWLRLVQVTGEVLAVAPGAARADEETPLLSATAPVGWGLAVEAHLSRGRVLAGLWRGALPVALGLAAYVAAVVVWVLQATRSAASASERAERLAASERRLELALRGGDLSVLEWAPQREAVLIDAAWAARVGLVQPGASPATSLSAWLERIHPADRPRLERTLARLQLGAIDALEVDCRVRGVDAWVWVRARGQVSQRDAAGAPRLVTGVVRDVSSERQAEETRRHLQQQVEHAGRLESLAVLAGGVAHDLNNVLVAVLGNADVARSATEATQRDAALDEVTAAARRAAALTQQLLAFGRSQPRAPRPIDLREVVRRAAGLLERLVPEDRTFRLELAEEACPVEADPAQLEQVLVNLCVNARDATGAGGEVAVRVDRRELPATPAVGQPPLPPGPYAALTVRDDGSGMSPEVQRRLFEPFFTTKGLGQGTGLGLPSVLGIVQQHQGAVLIDSELGRGSSFTIALPLRTDLPLSEERRALHHGSLPRSDQARVLVVEDERAVRDLTRDLLVAAGHTVLLAEDGDDAVALLEREAADLDLVVADVVLPGRSGAEVLEAVRALRPDLPVLLVTGFSPEDVGSLIAQDERTSLLLKPYGRDDLLRAVASALP